MPAIQGIQRLKVALPECLLSGPLHYREVDLENNHGRIMVEISVPRAPALTDNIEPFAHAIIAKLNGHGNPLDWCLAALYEELKAATYLSPEMRLRQRIARNLLGNGRHPPSGRTRLGQTASWVKKGLFEIFAEFHDQICYVAFAAIPEPGFDDPRATALDQDGPATRFGSALLDTHSRGRPGALWNFLLGLSHKLNQLIPLRHTARGEVDVLLQNMGWMFMQLHEHLNNHNLENQLPAPSFVSGPWLPHHAHVDDGQRRCFLGTFQLAKGVQFPQLADNNAPPQRLHALHISVMHHEPPSVYQRRTRRNRTFGDRTPSHYPVGSRFGESHELPLTPGNDQGDSRDAPITP